jgi:uncharacterized repeat protein (TIGR03809 family)
MSERQQGPYDSTARRWLALIERRQENFIELCNTGRWRRYYSHAQFLDEMRKVLQLRDQWAQLAGVPVSEDLERIDLQQDVKQSDRHEQRADARELVTLSRGGAGQRRRPPSAILAAIAGRL